MKNIALILATWLLLYTNVYGQNFDYDIQSCFNENKTVQAALFETLMSESRIGALNTMLEISITEADVANLRPLTQANTTDVELCNYLQSRYTQSTWNSLGTIFFRYFYRANDFLFVVNPRIPKDITDPDFALAENSYWMLIVTGFDPQSGFQYPSIVTGLKHHPDMVLPNSGN